MSESSWNDAPENSASCPRLRDLIAVFGSSNPSREAAAPEADDALIRHAATCDVCRRWLDQHGHDLAGAVARLPREIVPARDLWPEISGRLAARPVRRRTPLRAWLAAAALLAIGLAAGYLLRDLGASGDDQGSAGSRLVESGRPASAPGVVLGTNEEGTPAADALAVYRSATLDLRSAIETRLAEVDPRIRTDLEAHLSIIEAAISELESALAETPKNPQLEGLLLARYRQQVSLLTRFVPEAG